MSQLLCAIENNTEPEISGRDNIETLRLCEAVLESSLKHECVRM
jgi:predicted dehydrogenase